MGRLDDSGVLKVNGTDYPLAEYFNQLFSAALLAGQANTEVISATKTLDDGDYQFQFLDGGAADRDVELAPEATTNHPFLINNTGTTNDLIIKDDSGVTTFITLVPAGWALFMPLNAEGWKMIEGRDSLKTYFDTLYDPLGGGTAADISGWMEVTDTWTRTGNHTFTIPGDVTATYSKNKKIRYRDGGSDEYGVILSSSEAAGTTTIQLMPNSTYAMAAATITDTYLSNIENPDGWDTGFDYGVWTPTLTDLNSNTSSLTAIECQYHRVGDTVQCSGVFQADAIATTLVSFRMSLPFFTAVFDSATTRCGGTLSDGSAGVTGRIGANTANGEADIAFVPNLTTNRTYYFTFMFKVVP
jgi:hypothetical protein